MRGQLVARGDELACARWKHSAGQPLHVDRDPSAASDVSQELAKAGADVQHDIVRSDISLEEVRAEDLPDGVFGGAVLFRETYGVKRIEAQLVTRQRYVRVLGC